MTEGKIFFPSHIRTGSMVTCCGWTIDEMQEIYWSTPKLELWETMSEIVFKALKMWKVPLGPDEFNHLGHQSYADGNWSWTYLGNPIVSFGSGFVWAILPKTDSHWCLTQPYVIFDKFTPPRENLEKHVR